MPPSFKYIIKFIVDTFLFCCYRHCKLIKGSEYILFVKDITKHWQIEKMLGNKSQKYCEFLTYRFIDLWLTQAYYKNVSSASYISYECTYVCMDPCLLADVWFLIWFLICNYKVASRTVKILAIRQLYEDTLKMSYHPHSYVP